MENNAKSRVWSDQLWRDRSPARMALLPVWGWRVNNYRNRHTQHVNLPLFMLSQSKQKASTPFPAPPCFPGNYPELPCADNHFDLILSSWCRSSLSRSRLHVLDTLKVEKKSTPSLPSSQGSFLRPAYSQNEYYTQFTQLR